MALDMILMIKKFHQKILNVSYRKNIFELKTYFWKTGKFQKLSSKITIKIFKKVEKIEKKNLEKIEIFSTFSKIFRLIFNEIFFEFFRFSVRNYFFENMFR